VSQKTERDQQICLTLIHKNEQQSPEQEKKGSLKNQRYNKPLTCQTINPQTLNPQTFYL
jgi:hypothetical protein